MKKKKVLIIAGIVAVVVLAAVLVWYFVWGKNKSAGSQETTVKIETSAGQEVLFAQLTSVKGNEITYTVATEAGESSFEEKSMPNDGERPDMSQMQNGGERPDMSQMPNDGERPDMSQMPNGGEMPDMSQMPNGGERPDMSQMPNDGERPDMSQIPNDGEMPDMSQMPNGGEMPGADASDGNAEGGRGGKGGRGEMGQGGNRGGAQGGKQSNYAFSYDGTNYQLTEESRTSLIPVGTEVITKLGTVTTFSRLAAGDNVALVVENDGDEQVIVAVYIIG